MKRLKAYGLWQMANSVFFALLFVFLPSVTGHQPFAVLAHEAYVLPEQVFQQGLKTPGINIIKALQDPQNLLIFLEVTFGVLALLCLNLLFNQSNLGQALDRFLAKFSRFGPFVVRLTISAALFFSALSSSFLGPEMLLKSLPFSELIRIMLFIISGLFLIGFLTEAAAIVALLIYIFSLFTFGIYQFTYLNYLGELIVLSLFGLRYFSFDQKLFGKLKRFQKIKEYETTIVRVFYGAALLFTAISIKFMHPQILLEVVNRYNLTQFNLLFPQDPMLLVLGAVLGEVTIGIFIILGFQIRLTVLISLFYITLSLIFFREAVWPHLLLYGISFNLLTCKSKFSLDEYLQKKKLLQEKLVFP